MPQKVIKNLKLVLDYLKKAQKDWSVKSVKYSEEIALELLMLNDYDDLKSVGEIKTTSQPFLDLCNTKGSCRYGMRDRKNPTPSWRVQQLGD